MDFFGRWLEQQLPTARANFSAEKIHFSERVCLSAGVYGSLRRQPITEIPLEVCTLQFWYYAVVLRTWDGITFDPNKELCIHAVTDTVDLKLKKSGYTVHARRQGAAQEMERN